MAYLWSLLFAGIALADIYSGIDHDASPVKLPFNDTAWVGPDGPWWFIDQAIDFPDEIVQLRPGIVASTLVIATDACENTPSCPLPIPNLWYETGAYDVTGGPQTQSKSVGPSQWDVWVSRLLNLTGPGRFTANRMTLHPDNNADLPEFLDMHAMFASDGFQSNFPDASYTLDTGIFSLYGGQSTISWPSNSNGSTIEYNITLPDAYTASYIPSISFGLHIGSVFPPVSGSMILGGYDSSRCLTQPLISTNSAFQLTGVALNVSSGGSAYLDNDNGSYVDNLLDGSDSLQVHMNPAVPYMYLPRSVCDAIAQHLPITYNPNFNLYLWDTDNEAYEKIISSPHYLAMTFNTGSGTSESTINVPFILLNLTLDTPLISTPTQYFPCSPWDDDDVPYHLGAAFLQAAFLAVNWQTNTTFLGQAPGPDNLLPENRIKIDYTASTLEPAQNPPSWESSWADTLKALPANTQGSTDSPSNGASNSHTGLSGGAKAGIGVGVTIGAIALIGAGIFIFMRKRKNAKAERTVDSPNPATINDAEVTEYYGSKPLASPYSEESGRSVNGRPMTPADVKRGILEAPSDVVITEMSSDRPPQELAGDVPKQSAIKR